MPAMLTHDFFGRDAYARVMSVTDLYTPDERDAFLLGSQGPDPLFYLMLLPPLKVFERLGSGMHHVSSGPLLLSLRKAVDELEENDRSVGRAYLAGFACHYLLDRAVHPLVFYWERGICQAGVDGLDGSDGSVVHAEIERDLDEMVLFSKRGETIETYRPYREVLRGRDEMLRVIGDLYFASVVGPLADGEPTANHVYPLAVTCFRVAQKMFWSPSGTKTSGIAAIEGTLLKERYSLVRAMSHRVRPEAASDFDNRDHQVWRNPFTNVTSTKSFWDLYDGALEEVVPAVETILGDCFDEDAATKLTHGLNFGGEPVA